MSNENQEEDEKEQPSKTERFCEFLIEFFGEILLGLIPALLGAWFIIGSGMFFLILPFAMIIWIVYKKKLG